MQGKVLTPDGDIDLYVSAKQIKITGATGTGTLKFKSKKKPVCKENRIIDKGNGMYEMIVEKGKRYEVNYKL
jgi:hypothetical protein